MTIEMNGIKNEDTVGLGVESSPTNAYTQNSLNINFNIHVLSRYEIKINKSYEIWRVRLVLK